MARDMVPVLKRCRSLGLDPIYLGVDKKSNRQSIRGNRKKSEYGQQLTEKQKAKFIYGVLEKPFRNYFAKASKMKGTSGENLMVLLETRLDNVILVNGKRVNIPSYQIKAGDTIEIREKSKGCQRYKDILEVTGARIVPEWLEADQENLSGTVKALPTREQIDVPVNEMLIVELYSK